MDIKILLDKQRELDIFIAKEKNLGNAYDKKFLEDRKLALLVEVGEFANTTRCFKYWSNKGPEAKEVILDEAADCLHFILSLINLTNIQAKFNLEDIAMSAKLVLEIGPVNLITGFNTLFELVTKEYWEDALKSLIALVTVLGFTLKELHEAYLKKHEVNYQRQRLGY
ncbi:dUTP diphosphatase [Clostridium peptidivorans]|uniref:dUTP diphosphatase n=1 Tax=Clostridium peptidivorans TaxID=100174 RepID=UPI000BE23D75|nr:dUTP diphosphatase [Clostridium peptidivorans]